MGILKQKGSDKYFARCDICGYDFRNLFKNKLDAINEIKYYEWLYWEKTNKCLCCKCGEKPIL